MRTESIFFVYHNILTTLEDLNHVPVDDKPYHLGRSIFYDQMRWLSENNFVGHSVSNILRNNHSDETRVALTFDDGYLSSHSEVYNTLTDFGFTATFFLVPNWVGRTNGFRKFMTWQQINELAKAGMEIGSHTLTHPFLTTLPRQEVVTEFLDSKRVIEDQIQQPCNFISIPQGFTKPEYEDIAEECGYKGICDSRVSFRSHLDSTFWRIHRIGVRGDCTVHWLRSVIKARWYTKSRMILHDQIKTEMKKRLGLERWLSFRNIVLESKYNLNPFRDS